MLVKESTNGDKVFIHLYLSFSSLTIKDARDLITLIESHGNDAVMAR